MGTVENENGSIHTLTIEDLNRMWEWIQKHVGKDESSSDRLQLVTDILNITRTYAMWSAFILTNITVDIYERKKIEDLLMIRNDLMEFLRGVMAQTQKLIVTSKKAENHDLPGVS